MSNSPAVQGYVSNPNVDLDSAIGQYIQEHAKDPNFNQDLAIKAFAEEVIAEAGQRSLVLEDFEKFTKLERRVYGVARDTAIKVRKTYVRLLLKEPNTENAVEAYRRGMGLEEKEKDVAIKLFVEEVLRQTDLSGEDFTKLADLEKRVFKSYPDLAQKIYKTSIRLLLKGVAKGQEVARAPIEGATQKEIRQMDQAFGIIHRTELLARIARFFSSLARLFLQGYVDPHSTKQNLVLQYLNLVQAEDRSQPKVIEACIKLASMKNSSELFEKIENCQGFNGKNFVAGFNLIEGTDIQKHANILIAAYLTPLEGKVEDVTNLAQKLDHVHGGSIMNNLAQIASGIKVPGAMDVEDFRRLIIEPLILTNTVEGRALIVKATGLVKLSDATPENILAIVMAFSAITSNEMKAAIIDILEKKKIEDFTSICALASTGAISKSVANFSDFSSLIKTGSDAAAVQSALSDLPEEAVGPFRKAYDLIPDDKRNLAILENLSGLFGKVEGTSANQIFTELEQITNKEELVGLINQNSWFFKMDAAKANKPGIIQCIRQLRNGIKGDGILKNIAVLFDGLSLQQMQEITQSITGSPPDREAMIQGLVSALPKNGIPEIKFTLVKLIRANQKEQDPAFIGNLSKMFVQMSLPGEINQMTQAIETLISKHGADSILSAAPALPGLEHINARIALVHLLSKASKSEELVFLAKGIAELFQGVPEGEVSQLRDAIERLMVKQGDSSILDTVPGLLTTSITNIKVNMMGLFMSADASQLGAIANAFKTIENDRDKELVLRAISLLLPDQISGESITMLGQVFSKVPLEKQEASLHAFTKIPQENRFEFLKRAGGACQNIQDIDLRIELVDIFIVLPRTLATPELFMTLASTLKSAIPQMRNDVKEAIAIYIEGATPTVKGVEEVAKIFTGIADDATRKNALILIKLIPLNLISPSVVRSLTDQIQNKKDLEVQANILKGVGLFPLSSANWSADVRGISQLLAGLSKGRGAYVLRVLETILQEVRTSQLAEQINTIIEQTGREDLDTKMAGFQGDKVKFISNLGILFTPPLERPEARTSLIAQLKLTKEAAEQIAPLTVFELSQLFNDKALQSTRADNYISYTSKITGSVPGFLEKRTARRGEITNLLLQLAKENPNSLSDGIESIGGLPLQAMRDVLTSIMRIPQQNRDTSIRVIREYVDDVKLSPERALSTLAAIEACEFMPQAKRVELDDLIGILSQCKDRALLKEIMMKASQEGRSLDAIRILAEKVDQIQNPSQRALLEKALQLLPSGTSMEQMIGVLLSIVDMYDHTLLGAVNTGIFNDAFKALSAIPHNRITGPVIQGLTALLAGIDRPAQREAILEEISNWAANDSSLSWVFQNGARLFADDLDRTRFPDRNDKLDYFRGLAKVPNNLALRNALPLAFNGLKYHEIKPYCNFDPKSNAIVEALGFAAGQVKDANQVAASEVIRQLGEDIENSSRSNVTRVFDNVVNDPARTQIKEIINGIQGEREKAVFAKNASSLIRSYINEAQEVTLLRALARAQEEIDIEDVIVELPKILHDLKYPEMITVLNQLSKIPADKREDAILQIVTKPKFQRGNLGSIQSEITRLNPATLRSHSQVYNDLAAKITGYDSKSSQSGRSRDGSVSPRSTGSDEGGSKDSVDSFSDDLGD